MLLVCCRRLLAIVPVAALTAVMIMVSINTFSWGSLARVAHQSLAVLRGHGGDGRDRRGDRRPLEGRPGRRDPVGHLLRRQGIAPERDHVSELSEDGRVRTYRVEGQVFFASAGTFVEAIDVLEPVERS